MLFDSASEDSLEYSTAPYIDTATFATLNGINACSDLNAALLISKYHQKLI